MERFVGKRVLITGGSSGIGYAAAEAFLAEGARVVIAASGGARGQAAEAALAERFSGRVRFIRCDVAQKEQVEALLAGAGAFLGGLDVLFSNAGVSAGGSLEASSEADWDRTLSVNLKGAFLCAKAALPMLKESRGVIINTISELGLVATQNCLPYLCSKGGLVQLTRGLALELAPYGIRVNAVCPAGTDTPMFRADMGSGGNYDAEVARLAKSYPLGRIAVPEDIAPAVLFLASPESSFITGQLIMLDGGFTIQ